MSNIAQRIQTYQKQDWEEVRVLQAQYKISLRQNRRLMQMKSRRFGANSSEIVLTSYISPYLHMLFPDIKSSPASSQLEILKNLLLSNDSEVLVEVLTSIKSMLGPYLQLIIESEIPKRLEIFLEFSFPVPITELSVWILSNILADDSSKPLISKKMIMSLFALVSPEHEKVTEHALWALANISLASEEFLDNLLCNKYLETLVLAGDSKSFYLDKVLIWSLCNITKDSERLSSSEVQTCAKLVNKIIKKNPAHEIVREALWVLVNLTAVPQAVQAVIDENLIVFAVKTLDCNYNLILSPALKTIGNVCAATHEHTQYILNLAILDTICRDCFVQNGLAKDTFWVLSNIAAGTPNQVKKLIMHQIFDWVVVSIVHIDLQARIQASKVLLNLMKTAAEVVKQKLCEQEVCEIMAVALQDSNADFVMNLLEICKEVIAWWKIEVIEASGLADVLERLVKHQNPEIANKILEILSQLTSPI